MRIEDLHSLTPFMNSFLRDFESEEFVQVCSNKVLILLKEEQSLELFFERKSLLGLHRYLNKIIHNEATSSKEISYNEFLDIFIPTLPMGSSCEEFLSNCRASRNNLAQILEKRKKVFEVFQASYLESEQSLDLGHPFHPFPKLKKGMTQAELIDYAPEFSANFKLCWIAVKENSLFCGKDYREELAGLKELVSFDLPHLAREEVFREDFLPLPMHPWQWEKLKLDPRIAKLIEQKLISPLGEGSEKWSALSSMRSLYHEKAPLLLKFSMDIKITNSLRHLKVEEGIRGIQIHQVLSDERLKDFFIAQPHFTLQYEPNFFALKDSETGEPILESLVQLREQLKNTESPNQKLLLATLVAQDLKGNKSHLRKLLEEKFKDDEVQEEIILKIWFQNFLKNCIEPFLTLSCDYGVLLGAHLQNLIVDLKDGQITGVTYKDCQGTGFSNLGHDLFANSYPFITKDNGNVLEEDDVNKVFVYYLVVNTVFTTISSLADSKEKMELKLLSVFRNFIYSYSQKELRSKSILNFLLNSPFLYQKGNFICSLNKMNESTDPNPWQIYSKTQNPIVQKLRRVQKYVPGELTKKTFTNLKSEISFRLIDLEKDLDIFYQWQHKEFVSEFWEMKQSKDQLKHYLETLLKSAYQHPLIFEINKQAVGYFEVYWAYDDRIAPYCRPELHDRGFHLLIGEEKYLRTKYIFEAFLHLSTFLFEDSPQCQNIWGEPRADNKKILRFAEALPGWHFVKEFDFPHKRAALLQCPRDQFFKELS